jgi:hypothetical protein
MKTMAFAALLTMLLVVPAHAVTGGLDFNLILSKELSTETTVRLASVMTVPRTETRMLVGRSWIAPPDKHPDRIVDTVEIKVGRIEYEVPVAGSQSYTTTLRLQATDTVVGDTDCTYVFDIFVWDQAFGPVAVIKRVTANGIESDEFEPVVSPQRCQVFPHAGKGPLMYIFQDTFHH